MTVGTFSYMMCRLKCALFLKNNVLECGGLNAVIFFLNFVFPSSLPGLAGRFKSFGESLVFVLPCLYGLFLMIFF